MNLKGVGVAMVTPFKEDGKLDTKSLEKLTSFLIENGVDYLVPVGTTGESVTITNEEIEDCLEVIFQTNNNRIPVVLGCGGNDTRKVAKRMERFASKFKIDAFLSVSPYYNKPSQNGIYLHYQKLTEATLVPIVLYNVPSRTGSEISSQTILKLANENPKIIGVKDATGNLVQSMEVINQKPANFQYVSGDDAITLPAIACGFEGVISVVGNALPNAFVKMTHHALNQDFAKAREYHLPMLHFIELLFKEGNPSGIKCALDYLNICKNVVRLPLAIVSHELELEIHSELDKFNAIFG